MSFEFEGFAQQGWQCPICRRVYSPLTAMCYYCGNGVPYTTTTIEIKPKTKQPTVDVDWMHHESITVSNAEKEENK